MTNFTNPLFIDIETVALFPNYKELPKRHQVLWDKKAGYLGGKTAEEKEALFTEKGGIFAEFGKIVTIVIGYLSIEKDNKTSLHLKGFSNKNEDTLLEDFKEVLLKFPQRNLQLCGHNGKEFDFPYLARRMLVQGISLPEVLNTAGKKPWEINHLDTMEMWKFGDYKHYTSLELLATLFDIPSSKDAMDGSEVGVYFYEKNDLASIERYCTKDVITTMQVYRRLKQLPLIEESAIVVH